MHLILIHRDYFLGGKQKAKEALGMSKPLSQNEDMKPAGGMETLCAPCWPGLYALIFVAKSG